MQQSRIFGNLQMTHSQYINEDKRASKEEELEDEQIFKTLVHNARKSYIARKTRQKGKGTEENIKIDDVKPKKKNNIFHQTAQKQFADLSLSQLPNYNVLNVQNISQNNVSCWNCDVFSHSNTEHQFFVEDPCRLLIYTKGAFILSYVFNFDTVEVELRENFYSSPKEFLLVAQSLILKISHERQNIIQSWYKQLKKIIQKSYGKMLNMNDIAIKNPQKFYKHLYCTQDEFTSNCQTGDILLFEDEHFFAKAQRFILNADYDHVAMIVRDKKYGILIFEASSLSGVSLNPWSCMIKYGWYKYINRIVWRRLENVERSKFFQQIIHKFVKENLKEKYFISFQKLLSNKSYIGKKEEEKGFFCSQLVAKIYKDLQLLTRNQNSPNYIASNNIYPYHFSEKYNLKLEMGNLSKEYEIHFNQELLKKEYGEKFIQG